MRKLLLIPMILIGLTSLPSWAVSDLIYNCKLMEGSTARHGVNLVSLTFAGIDMRSQTLVTLFRANRDGSIEILGGRPAVYTHAANIHKGRYSGFKYFIPSKRFPAPQFHQENFKSIAIQERSDRKSAILAFPDSKNAVYSCH